MTRHLLGWVAFVVLALLAGGLISAYQFITVSREAEQAEVNALPSVERLMDARTALRRLTNAGYAVLARTRQGRQLDRAVLDGPRQRLQTDLERYQALPAYAGEREQVDAVLNGLARIDELASQMSSTAQAPPAENVGPINDDSWRGACDALDDSIHTLMVFNAEHLRSHLGRIDSIRVRAFFVLWLVAFLSFVVALMASRLARALQQKERWLKERADEWELFSGRIAHDILSPLQTVGLALDIARKRGEGPEVDRATARGLAALTRVRAIADALLAFASAAGRPQPGERTSVSEAVANVVEVLRPIADEHFIEVSTESISPLVVACSAGILDVLLVNLLQNAIKYMGDRPTRRVALKILVHAQHARFEVHDTGPGLTAAEASHIFEPFVRSDVPGVSGIGLGLATVLRVAKAHGGAAGVRSVKGKGSVFWFELPTATAAEELGAPLAQRG